jgi:hypothetical protein
MNKLVPNRPIRSMLERSGYIFCILYGDLAFFIEIISLPDERKNKDGCLCQFDWLIFTKKQKESIA